MTREAKEFDRGFEARKRYLDELAEQLARAATAYQAAVRRAEITSEGQPNAETEKYASERDALNQEFSDRLADLQDFVGVPDEVFDAIAAAGRHPHEERLWRSEVEVAPPTGDLDSAVERGLVLLLPRVRPDWLLEEAKKSYRLGDDFLSDPLYLVGNVRLATSAPKPQRFARMLLVAQDHVGEHDRLDLFEAPMLVTEVAALGSGLPYSMSLARRRQRSSPACRA